MATPKFTYVYNASALGLGGALQQSNGATTFIPSLASVALAPSGGVGSNEVLHYAKDDVSFSRAFSSVVGFDSAYRTFTTITNVSIDDLDLFGRVKVARMATTVTSTRDVDGNIDTEADPDKARFRIQAMILGLSIDGVEVFPEFDIDLCECPTHKQFTTIVGGQGSIGKYAKRFGVEENELMTAIKKKAQPLRASFVSDIQHKTTDKFEKREGFKLPVKNFGHVHFGELFVKPGRRRVNLLRIEFDSTVGTPGALAGGMELADATTLASLTSGSPSKGSTTIMSLDGNGAPSWP